MQRYLAKIQFDCNDGDYVYGLKVLTEDEAAAVKRNSHKNISFGSCDFGENEDTVSGCVSIRPISEEEYNALKSLNLLEFGERLRPNELDSLDSDEEENESEDEDEDEESEDKLKSVINFPWMNRKTYTQQVIERTTPFGEVYYLREKLSTSNRETAHEAGGKSYEKITRKDRAAFFTNSSSDGQMIVDELNSKCLSQEFKLVDF